MSDQTLLKVFKTLKCDNPIIKAIMAAAESAEVQSVLAPSVVRHADQI